MLLGDAWYSTMKYVRDTTGRFPSRPHFEPAELDAECERVLREFYSKSGQSDAPPISTDALTMLIEENVDDLDLYADLSDEGPGVEGVTTFRRGKRPIVKISAELSADPRRVVRLRTTLGHEFGHVHFHNALFQLDDISLDLFSRSTVSQRRGTVSLQTSSASESAKCKRDNMIAAPISDWMEWQAGYVCGSLVIPRRAVVAEVKRFVNDRRLASGVSLSTSDGVDLVSSIADLFATSRDTARVRLEVLGLVSKGHRGETLFA